MSVLQDAVKFFGVLMLRDTVRDDSEVEFVRLKGPDDGSLPVRASVLTRAQSFLLGLQLKRRLTLPLTLSGRSQIKALCVRTMQTAR